MASQEIQNYIIEQRKKQKRESVIKEKLLHAGWDEEEITQAFSQIDTNDDIVPLPPRELHYGMWVGFLYVLFFISLYVLATAIGVILTVGVDKLLPDVMDNVDSYKAYSYYDSTNWAVNISKASIIVSYPIFACLLYALGKQAIKKPRVRNLRVRKLLIYITLIVTFIIMLGHLIATIFGFLNEGMISARAFGHLMVTFFISGSIFATLLYVVKEDKKVL